MSKKEIIKTTIFLLFVALFSITKAQASYKHSIGATIGTTQALSYKTFIGNHFAVQLDLGTKYCYVYGSHLWSAELAPNFMYEGHIYKGLHWFLGLGGSIGYNWQKFSYIAALHPGDPGYEPIPDPENPNQNSATIVSTNNCKAGANGIVGLEYKLDCPVTLQFDFRPGYRCIFNGHFYDHKYDWGMNFGVRYTF